MSSYIYHVPRSSAWAFGYSCVFRDSKVVACENGATFQQSLVCGSSSAHCAVLLLPVTTRRSAEGHKVGGRARAEVVPTLPQGTRNQGRAPLADAKPSSSLSIAWMGLGTWFSPLSLCAFNRKSHFLPLCTFVPGPVLALSIHNPPSTCSCCEIFPAASAAGLSWKCYKFTAPAPAFITASLHVG